MTLLIAICPEHGEVMPHDTVIRHHRAAKISDDYLEINGTCPYCNAQLNFRIRS